MKLNIIFESKEMSGALKKELVEAIFKKIEEFKIEKELQNYRIKIHEKFS